MFSIFSCNEIHYKYRCHLFCFASPCENWDTNNQPKNTINIVTSIPVNNKRSFAYNLEILYLSPAPMKLGQINFITYK